MSIAISAFIYFETRDFLFQVFTALGTSASIGFFLVAGLSYLFVKLFMFIHVSLGGKEINLSIKPKEAQKAKLSPFVLLPVLLIVLPAITGALVYYYLVYIGGGQVGETLVDKNPISYPSSRYVRVDNDVYFLKVGYGYFKLENVDIGSFSPFTIKNERDTEMAQDKHHVFSQQFIIPNIDVKSAVYVGKNYIRDKKTVFYQGTSIAGVDVATFERISFPNYPTFILDMNLSREKLQMYDKGAYSFTSHYSKDKNQVYYKETPLQNADVNSIRYAGKGNPIVPPYVQNYIKDKQSAYYQSKRLDDIDAKNFVAEEQTQALSYATDGNKHFVNGKVFPDVVNDKFFGTVKPNLNDMKLLQRKEANQFHIVFLDGRAVYYFDEKKQLFMHAKAIDNTAKLKVIDNGIFSDGENIYFTTSRRIKSRKYGTVGHLTSIYRSQLKETLFKKVKNIQGGTIYKHNQDYYLSIGDMPFYRGNSSLVKLKHLNVERKQIKKEHIDIISDVDLVATIKTRF